MTTAPQLLTRIRALGLTEKVWFNALWFQITWFLCVIGRDTWLPAAIAMVVLHFLLVAKPKLEATELAPVVALGVVVDALLSGFGVYDFSGALIPLWLCILWIAFATTLTRALAVFGKNRWIAAVVGGLGVPFNYAVGAKLGAVAFPMEPLTTGMVLVALWAVLMPGLYAIVKVEGRQC